VRHQEKKFDDWLVPLIKDADTEKKVRELHEKAYGLEYVKADRENLQREYQGLKQVVQQKYQPLAEGIQQLNHFKEQGNLPAVFKLLGLQNQEVFKWAYQYAQMSPEARSQMEENANTGMQAYGAQHQMSQIQQESLQRSAEFKAKEFEMLTTYNQEIASVQSEFDQRHGEGAFAAQVARTGDYYWRLGQDIPVEQAIQEVMKLVGRGPQTSSQPQVQGNPSQVSQGQQNMVSSPQAPTPKPVIPSMQGRGTSPAKKVYNSLDDIRKRRQELEAQD
jgi:hypothetical protein